MGADRICYTAWQQLDGLSRAGVEVLAIVGALRRPAPPGVRVKTTLAYGKLRLPYKALDGMQTFALHDWLVARQLEGLKDRIDIVHTCPLGARRTLQEAARLQIPTVLERPNAYTRFAYEVVAKECARLGIAMPAIMNMPIMKISCVSKRLNMTLRTSCFAHPILSEGLFYNRCWLPS